MTAVNNEHRFWQLLLAAELPFRKSRQVCGELDPADAESLRLLRQHPSLSAVEQRRMDAVDMDALQRGLDNGVSLLTSDSFSEVLEQSEGSPALFVQGDPSCLQAPTVAIVGTREASTYGKACAQKFSEALARAGVTIVSGGALGIDAAAHRGALAVGGRTAAVLAGGLDNLYPSVHTGLFKQIRERGCLVSQFPLGSRPVDYRFLMRNVTIAAASQAVLVVEAPPKSGSLSTAHAAAELGREVFVVPANIDQRRFWGSLNLLRDGATLVYHPDQILDSIGVLRLRSEEPPATESGSVILDVLTVQTTPVELIVAKTGMTSSDVLAELTLLELEGRVIRDSGGYALKP